VEALTAFLRKHAAQFTSVDSVLAKLEPARLTAPERIYEFLSEWRIRASRVRKNMRLRFAK